MKLLFSFIVIQISQVFCDIILNDFSYEKDQCKDICADSFFVLPSISGSQSICQRGCRFFNMIYLKDEHNLNTTMEECYSSCAEAYVDDSMMRSCRTGCKAMSKKKESELANVLMIIDQDNPNNVIILQPEFELLESDALFDPLMHGQIEIGYNIQYKIPEAKIRTMPIEEFIKMESEMDGEDWFDCAARNSGVPKWILFPAILTAIVIALWLSLGTFTERKEKQSLLEVDACSEVGIPIYEYSPEEIETIKKHIPLFEPETI